MKHAVSIVIPYFGISTALGSTLRAAIEAAENASLVSEYEFIIVDCASDSDALVWSAFPNLHVVRGDQKMTYIKAANKGMFHAMYGSVLLLCETTLLPMDYFDVMLPYLTQSDTFAATMLTTDAVTSDVVTERMVPQFADDNISAKPSPSDKLSDYTISVGRTQILIPRNQMIIYGGYNDLYSGQEGPAELDICLRAWSNNLKTYFNRASHCTVSPNRKASSLTKSQIAARAEYDELLIKRLYFRRARTIGFRLHSFFMFLLSILVPLDIFAGLRKGYFHYIIRISSIADAHRWKYTNFEIGLAEIKSRYFDEITELS